MRLIGKGEELWEYQNILQLPQINLSTASTSQLNQFAHN